MSYYFDSYEISKEALRKAIAMAFEERFTETGREHLDLAVGKNEDQFVIKHADTVFWGKIFFVPLAAHFIGETQEQFSEIAETREAGIKPVLFFPSVQHIQVSDLAVFPENTQYFEYYMRRTAEGQSVGLIAWHPDAIDKSNGLAEAIKKNRQEKLKILPPQQPELSLTQSGRLSQDEVSELLDLHNDLRKLKD